MTNTTAKEDRDLEKLNGLCDDIAGLSGNAVGTVERLDGELTAALKKIEELERGYDDLQTEIDELRANQ